MPFLVFHVFVFLPTSNRHVRNNEIKFNFMCCLWRMLKTIVFLLLLFPGLHRLQFKTCAWCPITSVQTIAITSVQTIAVIISHNLSNYKHTMNVSYCGFMFFVLCKCVDCKNCTAMPKNILPWKIFCTKASCTTDFCMTALCAHMTCFGRVWDSKAWRYVFATAKRDDIHDNWDMSKMIVDQKCQMWNGVKQIVMNVRHRRENFLWAGNPCHKLGPYDQYFCSTTIIQLSLILQTMGITWFWHCVNFDAKNSRFGTTMFTFTVGWQMCVTGRSRVQWYRLMLLQCHL